MFDHNHEAHVIVYSPQKMMHHPKYELQSYIFVVALDSGGTIELGMSDAEFREESTTHVFPLPPQASKMTGKLKVIAVYGIGDVSSGPIKVELPCYGKCIGQLWCMAIAIQSSLDLLPSRESLSAGYLTLAYRC